MSQCERCGASNEPTSRFCVSCGTPLVAPSPAVRPPELNPNANLPFAETAAPPTREEFERAQPGALMSHSGSPAPPPASPQYPSASRPPPAGPTAQPPAPEPAPNVFPTAAVRGQGQDPNDVPADAPRILAGFLVSYEPEPLGQFWPVYQGRTVIGREGAADGLDMRIAHPTISSRHAIFFASARPGRMKIEDGGSTNGTFVNEVRLTRGQRVEVRDGDRIRFGLFSALVKII